MSSAVHHTPELVLTTDPIARIGAEFLVLPVFETERTAGGGGSNAAIDAELGRAVDRGEFKGERWDVLPVPMTGVPDGTRVLAIGIGKRADLDADVIRRYASTAGLAARQRRASRIGVVLPDGVTADAAVQAAGEGLVLANFDGASYKSSGVTPLWLQSATIVVPSSGPALTAALERGRVLGECSNIARALANEPGNRLTPRILAERAVEVGRAAGLQVEVLDEHRLAELGMGMLLAVAQGSAEPPRLIVLRHEPAQPASGEVLGLVGKGITFDTGGISLKPAEKMERMKDDMSGGAAVLGAMAAIARLGAPVRCIGVIACSENMPGGRAIKPGDVVRSAEGKTVEITNTDAEGRLVLGDALWYARRLGATRLVDIATLTGGCMVALGLTTAGLFGTPVAWRDEVQRAGNRAGDRLWPMPDFPDFMDALKSDIADFSNSGVRWGSASIGAVFVKEFTGGLPWVHLDIAGPAWAEETKPYQAKGASGVGVRTLAELALAASAWGKL
jgi:leucyl aminopeptidase